MEVTEGYLEDYATNIQAEPEELSINGLERLGGAGIGADDPDGTFLNVLHEDNYERIKDIKEGTANRRTFVQPLRGGKIHGDVVYAFQGLKRLKDIKDWYRAKFDIKDPEPETPPAPSSE